MCGPVVSAKIGAEERLKEARERLRVASARVCLNPYDKEHSDEFVAAREAFTYAEANLSVFREFEDCVGGTITDVSLQSGGNVLVTVLCTTKKYRTIELFDYNVMEATDGPTRGS